MKGNTLEHFLDDTLMMGGPEKEFIFRDKYYFLEAICQKDGKINLHLGEYDLNKDEDHEYLGTHNFAGKDLADCTNKFTTEKVFDGLDIYEAESEIKVLFG